MNEKGIITPIIVSSIMLISLMFLAVFYGNVAKNNVKIQKTSNSTHQLVERRTAQERAYGVLSQEFDKEGTISFDDIEKDVKIKELSNKNQKNLVEPKENSTIERELELSFMDDDEVYRKTIVKLTKNLGGRNDVNLEVISTKTF